MKNCLTAYISGCHSDEDPSPGVGIARSLRESYPDARLVGVDYSILSSGIHSDAFTEAQVQPRWGELDLNTYANQIDTIIDNNTTVWISGLDVEIAWLAKTLPNRPRLLIPSSGAQESVRKPSQAVHSFFEMKIPRTLPATANPTELYRLGRSAGWKLWVKGSYHEAYSANSFRVLIDQIDRLKAHWPVEQIFVQEHADGLERAYTFSAYQGRLLDAVEVEKRAVTARGKTWAAEVTPCTTIIRDRIAAMVSALSWTGGGEIEFRSVKHWC